MKKTGCFKDNIRNLFLLYAIIPVMLMVAGGLLVFVLVWRNELIKEVNHSNTVVSSALEETIDTYSDGLNQLCKGDGICHSLKNPSKNSELFEQIYNIQNMSDYKADIYIMDENRKPILTEQDKIPESLKVSENGIWGIYRLMEKNPQQVSMKISISADGKYADFLLGRPIITKNKKMAYVVFLLEGETLDFLLSSVSNQTVVTDLQGRIFITNQHAFSDNLNRINSEISKKNGFFSYKGKHYMIQADKKCNFPLRIYTVADISSQVTSFIWMGIFLGIVFLGVLVMVFISAEPLVEKNTKELFDIVEAFEQVMQGSLDGYLSLKSCKEFQIIAKAYNMMLRSLKIQNAKNQKMTEDIAFIQLKQLESQFNPHFIYNTLENIRIMIKLGPKQADEMILALSSLLRYSVQYGKDSATVQEDIENLKNYLKILKMRFQKKFQYKILLEESVMECQIPRLLLQPLIENAIQYGMADQGWLEVCIEGYEKDGIITLICRDNGSGIDNTVLEDVNLILEKSENRSGHLGLYNIHKRIRLKYGRNYGVQIQSTKGAGTVVSVRLPADRKRV